MDMAPRAKQDPRRTESTPDLSGSRCSPNAADNAHGVCTVINTQKMSGTKKQKPRRDTASSSPKPSTPNGSQCRPRRNQCLLAPRPYEDIYHERAYLATYLQQKTQRIEGLIREYSETEALLEQGAEGKTRRRLRKLLNLLRCKLDEASEQERAIFSRMGELYMELNSRDTWERARGVGAAASYGRGFANARGDPTATPCTPYTPSTPCPSFASAEWSVATDSPVSVSVSAMPDPRVQVYQVEHPLPRYLASECLETVPEDEELEKPPPPVEFERPEIDTSHVPTCFKDPEMGTLQYDFANCNLSDEVEREDEEFRSDAEQDSTDSSSRIKRFSLPVMQFSWPDK